MIDRIESWYRGRTTREQWLLIVMAALFALVVLLLGIVRPLGFALADARERHAAAVTSLGRVRADADALRALSRGAAPAAPGEPLPTLVSAVAAEAGFANAGVAPAGGGRVNLTIASARPPALFGMIGTLARRGAVVERLSAQAATDGTLSVDMTLTGGGR